MSKSLAYRLGTRVNITTRGCFCSINQLYRPCGHPPAFPQHAHHDWWTNCTTNRGLTCKNTCTRSKTRPSTHARQRSRAAHNRKSGRERRTRTTKTRQKSLPGPMWMILHRWVRSQTLKGRRNPKVRPVGHDAVKGAHKGSHGARSARAQVRVQSMGRRLPRSRDQSSHFEPSRAPGLWLQGAQPSPVLFTYGKLGCERCANPSLTYAAHLFRRAHLAPSVQRAPP